MNEEVLSKTSVIAEKEDQLQSSEQLLRDASATVRDMQKELTTYKDTIESSHKSTEEYHRRCFALEEECTDITKQLVNASLYQYFNIPILQLNELRMN